MNTKKLKADRKHILRWDRVCLPVFLLACSCLLEGCGGSGRPALAKVVGTVTWDREPVAGALVMFSPAQGRPSAGYTESSGRFELKYIKDIKGAVPGTHRVCIEVPPKGAAQNPNRTPPDPDVFDWPEELDVKKGANEFQFDIASLSKR